VISKVIIAVAAVLGAISCTYLVNVDDVSVCNKNPESDACWRLASSIHSKLKQSHIHILQPHESAAEEWVNHSDSLSKGERFKGDCDDFASTANAFGKSLGLSESRVKSYLVTLGYMKLHAVTRVGNWVVDNRRPFVTHWDKASKEWIAFNEHSL